jgi:ATP-dependent Clp protease adaptor protein ClpS
VAAAADLVHAGPEEEVARDPGAHEDETMERRDSQVARGDGETGGRTGTITESEEEVREDLARLWRVICHDDPHTTMEFVVEVFTGVFQLPARRAFELMLRVHETGSAVIGLWPRSVAERKIARARARARAGGFPLAFSMEEDD